MKFVGASCFSGAIYFYSTDCMLLLIPTRTVKGGGAGDVEAAFTVDKACTLLFCNSHSWVRLVIPKYRSQ